MKKKRELTEFKRLKIDLLDKYRIELNFFNFINNTDNKGKHLIRANIERLYKIRLFKKYIVYEPFPKTIIDLKHQNVPFSAATNLNNAVYWEANVLKIFKRELKEFESLRHMFEINFVKGEFETAHSILEDIESKFGYSMWLIENKMLLINYAEGFSELRKFVNAILDNDNINGVVKLLVDFTSNKIDSNMNSKQYEEYIKDKFKDLRNYKLNPQLMNYVSFRLNCSSIEPISSYFDVISFESDSSILDRYISFKQVAQQIDQEQYQDIFSESIDILNKYVDEVFLNNLHFFYNNQNNIINSDLDKDVNILLEHYTNADYLTSSKLSKKILDRYPYIIEVCEIYIKSLIRNSSLYPNVDNTFLNDILKNMYNILLKNDKSYESYLSLSKLLYSFSTHHWSATLYDFLHNAYNDDNSDTIHKDIIIAKLNSIINTPKKVEVFLTHNQGSKYLNQIENMHGSLKTTQLFKALHNNLTIQDIKNIKLPTIREKYYIAKYLKNNNQFESALALYDEIFETDDTDYIDIQNSLKGKIRCLIELNRIDECISLISSQYIENNNLYKIFPISEIIQKMKLERIKVKDFLSLSILYDICIKHLKVNSFIFLDLQNTYEDVLYTYNLEKPKGLLSKIDVHNRKKSIYFLRYICIPNVMDTSSEFYSSNELYEERIKICQILIELDSRNHDIYSNQIKEYTAKLFINKKMSEIEQSKIYVDIEGIKKISELKLKESYTRYMKLLTTDKQDKKNDYIEIEGDDGVMIQITTNDRQMVFWKIFYHIRDLFTTNSDYGLDTYLSVNIRHGTLSGLLRKPLEAEHLITLRNEKTNVYKDNEYWIDKYYYDEENLENVLKYLNDFSKRTDRLINILKNNWIQILTESKMFDNGMFAYIFGTHELEDLESHIHPKTTYEEFTELIFSKLWEVTEENLEVIRTNINNVLMPKYNRIFDVLQKRIANMNSDGKYKELDQSITKSRTELLNSLVTVSNWFKRSKTFNTQDYTLDLAIDIARNMIENIYPHKNMETKISSLDYMFKGITLNNFVTIFYTIFDNCIQRSGLEENSIKITINFESNQCKFICINDIDEKTCTEERITYVNQLENDLNIRQGMEKVRKEGGSGFYKIIKILNTDLFCKTSIKLKYLDKKYFYSEIILEREGLYYENIDC